eukprot:SAG25_NODE_3782_length_972_cov_1.446735_2_plen_52_part_01
MALNMAQPSYWLAAAGRCLEATCTWTVLVGTVLARASMDGSHELQEDTPLLV